MLCRVRVLLQREHRTAVREFRASIQHLVVLVDNSVADREFALAHQRIIISRWACEVARFDLENHRAEHEC